MARKQKVDGIFAAGAHCINPYCGYVFSIDMCKEYMFDYQDNDFETEQDPQPSTCPLCGARLETMEEYKNGKKK